MVAASSRCRESAAFPACVGHEVVAAAYYTELAGQRDCSCWPREGEEPTRYLLNLSRSEENF